LFVIFTLNGGGGCSSDVADRLARQDQIDSRCVAVWS
jgi:hypothetical protein